MLHQPRGSNSTSFPRPLLPTSRRLRRRKVPTLVRLQPPLPRFTSFNLSINAQALLEWFSSPVAGEESSGFLRLKLCVWVHECTEHIMYTVSITSCSLHCQVCFGLCARYICRWLSILSPIQGIQGVPLFLDRFLWMSILLFSRFLASARFRGELIGSVAREAARSCDNGRRGVFRMPTQLRSGDRVSRFYFLFFFHFNVVMSHLFEFGIIDIPNFYQILVKKKFYFSQAHHQYN